MLALIIIIFIIVFILIYKLGLRVGENMAIKVTKQWVITILAKHIVLAKDMSSHELIDSICRDFGFNITKEDKGD